MRRFGILIVHMDAVDFYGFHVGTNIPIPYRSTLSIIIPETNISTPLKLHPGRQKFIFQTSIIFDPAQLSCPNGEHCKGAPGKET